MPRLSTQIRFIFSCLTFIFLLSIPFKCYADITTGLVLWWKLEEPTGTNPADSSGKNNPGVQANSPVSITGKRGLGLRTDGVNQEVYSASTVTVGKPFTICMWTDRDSGSVTWSHLADTGAWTGWYGSYRAMTCVNNTVFGNTVATPNTVPVGVWYHACFTVDASDNMQAYGNGVAGASALCTQIPAAVAYNFSLGDAYHNTFHDNYYKASYDDVRIYNRVLSAADIQALYRANNITGATLKNFTANN